MVSIATKHSRQKKHSRVFLFFFFFIFAAIGGGMLYPLGIRPIKKTFDAESWPEVPCKVLSAHVETHESTDSDSSDTYSIEIKYQYQYDGRTYTCDNYDFIGGSSSGYDGKARIVEQYKNAKNPVCYVNPEKPSEAILKRGFHLGLLLALFPIPFLAVGIIGMVWVIKGGGGKSSTVSTDEQWLPDIKATSAAGIMPVSEMSLDAVIMKPKSPWARLAGAILLALFWNGVVSVFVFQIVQSFQSGHPNWFMTLFMIPFVLVGLLFIGYIVYAFLSLFNPLVTVILSSATVSLGGMLHLKWNTKGKSSMIENLKIHLKGTENATYRRGTNTYTDRNTFYNMEVYSTDNAMEIQSGQIGFAVPADTMHSFAADNNKIVWEIELKGSIKKWPDINEKHEIGILPLEVA